MPSNKKNHKKYSDLCDLCGEIPAGSSAFIIGEEKAKIKKKMPMAGCRMPLSIDKARDVCDKTH